MSISKLQLHRLYAFPAVFLLFFTVAVFKWVEKYFNDVNLYQILFFINTSVKGADTNFISKFMRHCILLPALYALMISYIPALKCWRLKCKISYTAFVSLLSVVLTIGYVFYKVDTKTLEHFFVNEYTSFYEQHYTEPYEAEIKFKNKKNLIVLHIESLEKTFEDKEIFGQNLLENLRPFEKSNVQFQNFQDGFATDFTQGSVIALFTGMPVKYHHLVNKFGKGRHFFKDYYSLGQILKENGYVLGSVQGTGSTFAGMGVFLKDNGFTDITDEKIIQTKYPQYEKNGTWGYTDDVVLEIAKAKVEEMSLHEPYFLYVQTIDTHVGYQPTIKNMEKSENVYYEIIRHTTSHIAEFLRWMEQRPDYKDTVIVVLGDHLRMGNDFEMPQNRSVYNLFINAFDVADKNRTFTQVDLFPTVVEALGGKMKGHRLGIGTSLFSSVPTFSEIYSKDYLYQTLSKRNKLYEKKFMP